MRLAITGAAGELGRAVLQALMRRAEPPDAVLAVDRTQLDALTAFEQPPWVSWHDVDIASRAFTALILDSGIDTVIHCAAVTGVAAEADPEATLALNTHATDMIAAALSERGPARRLVLASSVAALGVFPPGQAAEETAPRRPRSVYGLSKALAELKLEELRQNGSLDARVLRLPTLLVRKGNRSGPPTSGYLSDLVKAFRTGRAIALPAPLDFPVAVNAGAIAADALVTAALMSSDRWGSLALANLPAYPATAARLLSLLRELTEGQGPPVTVTDDQVMLAKIGAWPQALSSRLAAELDPGHDRPAEQRLRRLLLEA